MVRQSVAIRAELAAMLSLAAELRRADRMRRGEPGGYASLGALVAEILELHADEIEAELKAKGITLPLVE